MVKIHRKSLVNQNQNTPMESRRPLNAGDEVKEEKLDDQKEANQNVEHQEADNNEEKIDS